MNAKHLTFLCPQKNYQAINRKEKRFEFCEFDERVKVGTIINLVEINVDTLEDTGGVLPVKVLYIQYGGESDIPKGYMILSIEPV